MKKIFALVIFCSLMAVTQVFSQDRGHVSIQYEVSFATGDLGEYISSPSFRGASFQYRYAATDNILVGVDVGWNVFYEKKDYDSYSSGTATLSGVQWRTQNQVPILIAADYSFMPGNSVKPYIGFGLGTMYTERSTDMGTWRLQENPWHFAIKPEVGVLIEMSSTTSFKLSAKYLTGFKAGDLETQSYFTIAAGLAFGF